MERETMKLTIDNMINRCNTKIELRMLKLTLKNAIEQINNIEYKIKQKEWKDNNFESIK